MDGANVPEAIQPMSKPMKNEEMFPSSLLDCKLRDRADMKRIIKHSQHSSVIFLPPVDSGKKKKRADAPIGATTLGLSSQSDKNQIRSEVCDK